MLPYEKSMWDFIHLKKDALIISGKGITSFCVLKNLIANLAKMNKKVMVFNCSESEKSEIIWNCANQSVEFLPKDIVKGIKKNERLQLYMSKTILFNNSVSLSKDFLQGLISPDEIDGFIIYRAEKSLNDSGLQLSIFLLKFKSPNSFVVSFSEAPRVFQEFVGIPKQLGTKNVLFYPRYEETVRESLKEVRIQIVDISLFEKNEFFSPVVSQTFVKLFHSVNDMFNQFLSEYTNINIVTAISLPKTALNKYVNDDEKVLESLLFLRELYFKLSHCHPIVFYEYLEFHLSSLSTSYPLWYELPQRSQLLKLSAEYSNESIPSPKLQFISEILMKLPADKKVLILAERASTVSYIGDYLSSFLPASSSREVNDPNVIETDDLEVLIDPENFGVMTEPLVILQELHSQSEIFLNYKPDYVIFWDVSLLYLRRLEYYVAKSGKVVYSYMLSYKEFKEMEYTTKQSIYENEIFKSLTQENVYEDEKLPTNENQKIIVVDEREFKSSMPFSLLKAGFEVKPMYILVGDYILTDDICIERKSYMDLVGSLRSGRLHIQIQKMRLNYKKPLLMLEFSNTPFNSITGTPGNTTMIERLLAIVRFYPEVKFIWGSSSDHCSTILMQIANNSNSKIDIQKLESKYTYVKKKHTTFKNFLDNIPFLSEDEINILTTNFSSISQLVKAKREELVNMLNRSPSGIQLHILLHSPFSTDDSHT